MKIITTYISNRKGLYLTLLFVSALIFVGCEKQNNLLSGKRILIIGDSITQDGTYVSFMEYYLATKYPEAEFDIISIGLGGETTCGLTEPGHAPRPCVHTRLDSALAKIKPELVFSCYGMNDGLYNPQNTERFQAYKDGILKVITKVKEVGAKVIILTPPVFDPLHIPRKLLKDGETGYTYATPYYYYDNVLTDYSDWIMSLKLEDVQTIDLHSPMKAYLTKRHEADSTFFINKDGIHPTPFGHLLMTDLIMEGIKIPLNIQDLDHEFERVTSDTLYQLINKKRQIRSQGWLEYIGYTTNKTVKTNNIDSIKVMVSNLQKQIDQVKHNAAN